MNPKYGEKRFLFLACFLLYAITSSGDLIGDSEVRWTVAKRAVDVGRFDVPPASTPLSAPGVGGRSYSFYGPGQSVCFIPFVLAGRLIASLSLGIPGSADMFGQFLASLIFFPLCGAAAAVLVYAVVIDATRNRRAALWTAVIFAVATMHWQHTVNTYEESQIAVCMLMCLWAVQRSWRHGAWWYLLLAFAATGVALCFRASSIVLSIPLCLVGFARDLSGRPARRLRRFGQWVLAAVVGAGPFIAAAAIYNVVRFGSPLETGYGPAHMAMGSGIRLFQTPLWVGLSGMLLSPGKSVFLYNPVLLMGFAGLVWLWRSHRALAGIVLAVILSTLLFHAKYTFWAGDLAWGPRFLASVMGFWVLALVPVLQRRRLRWVMVSLVAASICIQAASVVYSFGLEFFQDRRHGTIPDEYVWRPAESQMFCRFRNIALHSLGRPIFDSIPPDREAPTIHKIKTSPQSVQRLHAVNIFPFKSLAIRKNYKLFWCLLGLWVGCIVLLGAWIFRRRRLLSGRMETAAGG